MSSGKPALLPIWFTLASSMGAVLLACLGITDACGCPPSIIGASVEGRVQHQDGSPAAGARVYVAGGTRACPAADTLHAPTVADSLGHYSLFLAPTAVRDSACFSVVALPSLGAPAGPSAVVQLAAAMKTYPPGPLDTLTLDLTLGP